MYKNIYGMGVVLGVTLGEKFGIYLVAILVGKMVVSCCAYGCTNRQWKVLLQDVLDS